MILFADKAIDAIADTMMLPLYDYAAVILIVAKSCHERAQRCLLPLRHATLPALMPARRYRYATSPPAYCFLHGVATRFRSLMPLFAAMLAFYASFDFFATPFRRLPLFSMPPLFRVSRPLIDFTPADMPMMSPLTMLHAITPLRFSIRHCLLSPFFAAIRCHAIAAAAY